ncbi:MAG: hypothetical protein IVW52_12980 [Acidimicrobiales bacterium]|nr:hypothetical protein [Acidimicrobiales bacterium]
MADSTSSSRSAVTRALAASGRFWWEFLIGDTPELFVGAVAIIGAVALLCLDHSARDWAGFVLALLVAGLLVGSVWKAARKAR